MTIPGWLIVLIIMLFGIRAIFRNFRDIRRINKTQKIEKTLDEIESDLQAHESVHEVKPTKDNVIEFPQHSNK